MANFGRMDMEEGITKEEFKQLKDAFKKEEFRKMFADYVEEMNDPKNKAIYEKEVTLLEKERGIDVTFVHPNPGYVLKTSVNGSKKAFINICSNEHIGKPESQPSSDGSQVGLRWTLPYIQAPPRDDLDKSRTRCVVYDVVFHPDTLYLTFKNSKFRDFVNETAIAAVERSFNVSLDKNNIKFPKLSFKGPKIATVIRKKAEKAVPIDPEFEPLEIPNYPYGPIKEAIVTNHSVPNIEKNESDKGYTTPKYTVKYRKAIEMDEFTEEIDAKMYAATPTELVIIIDLPLVKSTSDVKLDVNEKSLSLKSEKPAKYLLEIELPLSVDYSIGTAKFDKSSKKLHVTLPVLRRKYKMTDFVREDSGIESDPGQSFKSSSEEDISSSVQELSLCDKSNDEFYRTNKKQEPETFLKPDVHYTFPSYSVNTRGKAVAVILDVKNVDSSTVKHKILEGGQGVAIALMSIGSGFFPVPNSFCISFPNAHVDPSSIIVEVTANVVLRFSVKNEVDLIDYFCGPNPDSLCKQSILEPATIAKNITNRVCEELEERAVIDVKKSRESATVVLSGLSQKQALVRQEKIPDTTEEKESKNIGVHQEDVSKNLLCAFEQSKDVEEHSLPCTDSESTDTKGIVHNHEGMLQSATEENDSKDKKKNAAKLRTLSESGTPGLEPGKRSILKCNRSLSESNVDDYNIWSSLDSSDFCIPEEITKKTVRFSDVISEKIFRANSSILGQRKKNQRKSRNKKRAHERRTSESEEVSGSEVELNEGQGDSLSLMSDVSSSDISSDASEVDEGFTPQPEILPSSKAHRRRGHKNRRKNAATAKHNASLADD